MIKQITLKDIEPYKLDAQKHGISFCKNAHYFGYFDNKQLVGITGVIVYANKLVFKSSYVVESHRRMGIYHKMFDFRMGIAMSKGIKKVEATCTKMSLPLWLNMNAQVIAEYKHYTKVQITL